MADVNLEAVVDAKPSCDAIQVRILVQDDLKASLGPNSCFPHSFSLFLALFYLQLPHQAGVHAFPTSSFTIFHPGNGKQFIFSILVPST